MTKDIIKAVINEYDISVEDLAGKSRKKPLPEARKMLSLFLSKKMIQADIAKLFGCNRSTISYNVSRIENHIELYNDVKNHFERIYKIVEPQGAMEILIKKRRTIETSLIENPLSPPDFRYAQIKELDNINNKISNLLKVEL